MNFIRKNAPSVAKLLLFCLLFSGIYCYTRDTFRGSNMHSALPILVKQPDNSYDVIFAGSSHMQLSIQPAQLFAEQGIVSCNTASASQSIPTTYFVLKEMIDRHDPQLVVLDLFCLYGTETYFTRAWVHEALDSFPLSRNKAEAINALVEEDREEFYLHYLFYHGRWKSLEKADYIYELTKNEKYQFAVDGIQPYPDAFVPVDRGETEEIPPLTKEYLEKIIALCEEQGTQLLLTVVPYRADKGMHGETSAAQLQKMYNSAEKLAEELGVDYFNSLYCMDEIGIDFMEDLVDPSHVNALGAEKVSEFYGKYLSENYELPDRRDDEKYSDWQDACAEYAAVLEEKKELCRSNVRG